MTTRAVPNSDPKKSLHVIWDATGTRILSDKRNQQPSSKITLPSQQQSSPQSLSSPTTPSYQKPSRVPKPRQIVKGPKKSQ